MSLVLGVMGIPKVEIELLRIIIRLSSNLRAPWTISEAGVCDVLLLDSASAAETWHAPAAPVMVVPMVQRGEPGGAAAPAGRSLARPIFAEELVDLLNEVTPGVRAGKAEAAALSARGRGSRASLIRWPAQVTLQKNPVYLRLAAVLSKSAQSAESLSALGRVDVDECSTFLGLLEQEGVLSWLGEAPAGDALAARIRAPVLSGEAASQRAGLLSRIRRRLGLA